MSAVEKVRVLGEIAARVGHKRQAVAELGIAKSTYYRWHKSRVDDGRPRPTRVSWNRLTSREEELVLATAREAPELSSRQLAVWLTNHKGFAVSESTVYRLLKGEGLVKKRELQIVAGKEYHNKTTGPHQLWATDASYFRVVGWGYYYLVTVMDDYSRYILAHKLQRDMTSHSLIEVVQEAVDATGMTQVPVEDRTKLLPDNGSGYVSRAFREYLHLVGIRHILAAPFHPQTNGKLELYHRTLKRDVNQLPYEMPSELDKALSDFVDYYNHRRYHMAIGNVTPVDVLQGRRTQILQRRKEVQAKTTQNAAGDTIRPSGSCSAPPEPPLVSGYKVSHYC